MSLWIPITLAAAIFQTLRFMLQKTLSTGQLSTGQLSAVGATFARFAYSAPLIWIGLAAYLSISGQTIPVPGAAFWVYAMVGGLTQILATICVVLLFKQRNFAVGITFKKTEVIQTAIVGFIVLGEGVSLGGAAAIMIGLAAVLVLSRTPGSTGSWWAQLTNRATALGLGSGVVFAFSAVGYRGATLQFDDMEPALRAAITLGFVVTYQALIMAIWLMWKDRAELLAVWQTRRVAMFVGLTSMGGSFCWFFAFALQNAAYVKALGQVELIFSLMASVLFFREKISKREMIGMGLLGLSIVTLVLTI